jgi:hypothetical protein
VRLGILDLSVVVIYAVVLFVLAQWVSREKPGHQKDSSDYFLAGRALRERLRTRTSIRVRREASTWRRW